MLTGKYRDIWRSWRTHLVVWLAWRSFSSRSDDVEEVNGMDHEDARGRCRSHRGAYTILSYIVVLLCTAGAVVGSQTGNQALALTPPRGWNSYDSFSWIISEQEFLDNARVVSDKLLKFGYEYVVVDFLWYRKVEPGASVSSGQDVIDEWGRPMPDPARWPSSANGVGFTEVANQVHALGLKFGVHVMRGINTAAVAANTPIFGAEGNPEGGEGKTWMARDIVINGTECSWMPASFVGVNTSSEGGRAFIKSLYQQYASWGVDFIKHDCVFGEDDLLVEEIQAVSEAIAETGRPIVYSLSPGVRATPAMAMRVANFAHMYRVTSDDWDSWSDMQPHFDVARDFAAAGLLGASGLEGGRSWPDLDMLPFGWITDPGAVVGPHRLSGLSPSEQQTQVSLWAMAKSPLMYGGDLRRIDNFTLSVITNPVILEINAHSTHNLELLRTSLNQGFAPTLGLVDCNLAKSTFWVLKATPSESRPDLLCWTASSSPKVWKRGRKEQTAGCLNWAPTKRTSLKSMTPEGEEHDNGCERGILWTSHSAQGCPDTEAMKIAGTAGFEASTRTPFTQSSGDSSPVWRLTSEGSLVNEQTGLCAVANSTEETSVWVASGSSGQAYVAFFNLAANPTNVTILLDVVTKALTSDQGDHSNPSTNSWNTASLAADEMENWTGLAQWDCTGLNVWTGEDLGQIGDSLSAIVQSHGCAVFALTCTPLGP